MNRRAIGTGAALALATGLASGLPGGTAAAAAKQLPAFDDCREFTAHMRALAENEVTPYGLGGGPVLYKGAPIAEGAPTDARTGSSPTEAVGNGPTGTNVQEQGVDEPDIAKIDGDRVVSLVNGMLTVVETGGAKPRVASTLTFAEGHFPNEMLVLDRNRVLVIGTAYDQAPAAGKRAPGFAPDGYRPPSPQVVLTLVDLTDARSPQILKSETITGSYISARLTDGVARIVLSSQPRITFSAPQEGEPEAFALARNRRAVRNAPAEDFLPERQILSAGGKVASTAPLLGCGAVRHPEVNSGLGIISVLTLDTARGAGAFAAGTAAGVVSNGELVYASTDRLYLATTDYGWPNSQGGAPRPFDNSGADRTRTRIHAFDVTGRTGSRYVGTGAVPGYLLGRWALSEHEGRLRVATTTGQPWAPEGGEVSQSSVIVLDERGDRLQQVGSVSGLGKGERIRAVRWFDEVVAVVTFRQTDPLYLVDLADPTAPRVRGELKIPGYSAYLHPVGGDRLLGIGQDADAEGRVSGLQVSAFDMANLAKPTRSDAVTYGRGYTDVENDSRAFTYLPARRLAVLPAWITRKVSCPPDAQCVAAPDGSTKPGFVGEIQVPAALGITVGADGTLRKAGTFVADSYVLRVLPVGDRLAVITGTSVVLLDPETFRQVGAVRTVPQEKPSATSSSRSR